MGVLLLPALPVLLTVAEELAGSAAGTAGAIVWLAGNLGGLVVAVVVQILVHHPTAAFLTMAVVVALAAPLAARMISLRELSAERLDRGGGEAVALESAGLGAARGRAVVRRLPGEPLQDLGGVLVRGEDRIEDLLDAPLARDEGEAPVEAPPLVLRRLVAPVAVPGAARGRSVGGRECARAGRTHAARRGAGR